MDSEGAPAAGAGVEASVSLVSAAQLGDYLASPSTTELSNDAKEWLPSMFDGGIYKIMAAISATQNPSLSPTSLKEVLLSLLPEDSEIAPKALQNAEAVTDRYRMGGTEEAAFAQLGLRLDKAALRAVVIDSPAFRGDQAGELTLELTLVFFAGMMEGVYSAFMQMVEDLAQVNAETGRKVVGEHEIAAAWAAKLSEWSALFVVRGTQEEEEEEVLAVEAIIKEEAQYLLKIIMVQEQGTVTKLLKVESSISVGELAQKIKKKMLTPTQVAENKRYYLFWHDEDSDDTEGHFLDDDKLLSDYPSIRTESTIELVLAERYLQVYVSETNLKSCLIDEKFSLEKIIKTIVTDLGYREASRFGLILLADETETGETPAQAKLKSSKSFDLVQVKKDPAAPGSADSLKLGRTGSVKKNTKRPVSAVFVKAESGSVKNKVADKRVNLLNSTVPPASTSPIPSSSSVLTTSIGGQSGHGSPPPFSSSPGNSSPLTSALSGSPPTGGSLSRTPPQASHLSHSEAPLRPQASHAPLSHRLSLIDSFVIIQTKDRSEWLNRDLTLKEVGIEIFDSLLLVRQEKILSFYDRLDDDPIGLYSRLTEQADSILKQLESISSEIDAMKAGVVLVTAKKEILKVVTEYRGEDDFYIKVGDEIELLRRDGERWFGRVQSTGQEGYFPSSTVHDRKVSSENLKVKAKATMSGDGEQPVKMEGYLLKKGRNFDHWKKKYYRLRNRCMWYYKSETDEKPVGHFSILGAKINDAPNHKKKQNTFVILADGVERYLSAPSPDIMAQWVAILNVEKEKGS